MIEEPPLQQSRSRIRDQKISSPSKLSNMKNGAKSNLTASTESESSSNNFSDLDFIEKIDLKKLSLLILNKDKRSLNGNEEYIDSHSQFHEKEKIKKIIHKFIKMKSFPVNRPQLITKLLQILQIIFRSFSDKIFEEKDQSKNKGNKVSPQNSQDVKMILGIQCPICEKIFRSSYYVDIHISSRHPQYFVLWQNLKSPSPLYEYNQNKVSNNEEIEKVLKKIHKDLRKQKRNSSVSIEDRISNVEATMQNLGIINANQPQSVNVNHIHRSRRHSFNSINIASLHSNDAKQRKENRSKNDENEYNYSNDDQNAHNRSHRHHHSKSDEYEDEEQKPKSARAPPPLSVPNTPIVNQVPNSARTQATSNVPQSPAQDKQQNVRIQASSSAPSTPSKIPKIHGKPFIPNLQLHALKSQGQLPHPQLQLQPPKPQKPVQPNINTNDTDNADNDVTPEPRRKPSNSTAAPSRRPIPKRKPSSMNVPSVEIDNNTQTVVSQFSSPRLPDDKDDLNFSKVYKQPLSARSTIETVQPHQLPSKPPSTPVNPHNKRTIPIPSPKKNSEQVNSKVFSPSQPPRSSFTQVSPFSIIQVDQDNDDDASDEVHIQTGRLQNTDENKRDGQISSQKVEIKNGKIEDVKPKLPVSSPISVEISKRAVDVAVNDDDDDVPEEYFESVSSISSDSSELPEIDFKPKPKNSQDIKEQSNTRRKKRRRKNSDAES